MAVPDGRRQPVIVAAFCLCTLAHSYHLAGRGLHHLFGLLLVLLVAGAALVRVGAALATGRSRSR